MEISSLQNAKIKNLLKLVGKSRERKKQNLFVVEGNQENQLALENNFKAVQFFVWEDVFKKNYKLPQTEIYSVTADVYSRISYRSSTEGIIGIYEAREYDMNEIKKAENPLILVLESVEKPGNLGAVLRTADAAAATAVVVCDLRTDFFNPNVIRSSVGTVFTKKLIACEKEEFVAFCQSNHIQMLATYLRDDTENLFATNLKKPTALIFGAESTGLSDFWAEIADKTIRIPMHGQVDSINVSNSVAICLYEAVRQRRT